MAAAASLTDERQPLLDLRGVAKDYVSGAGIVRALRDVDLEIHHGEFVAVVGTSGSGKSTLMNILGCLDRPTRGTYALAGLDVGGRTNDGRAIVRNRLIGFIFQGFNLLPRTTALENVELPLQYRGVPAAQRRKRALEALDKVGLGDRVHHTPNQLSGGQQQRVAIARALVTDPPLLLADEPTGNLDTRTSLEVLALLQELNRTQGITILLVTHEHDIAACASRVVTFRDGRITSDVAQDEPLDAEAALAELPAPQEGSERPEDEDPSDPAEAARLRLGGPVPFAVYAAMLGGGLLGAAVGGLYDAVVLGQKVLFIPALLGVLGEAFVGARFAKRKLGRALTGDQRARVAIAYTIGLALLATPIAWWKMPAAFGARLEHLGAGGAVLSAFVAVLAVAALALLRFLLLALFSPSARPRRAPELP
jgi:putative ABC transport system ATP-binding protein